LKFRLSEEDTTRLGLPEVLDFDWSKLTVAEAREVKQVCGVNAVALPGLWATMDLDAVLAVVWLAAKRAGVDLDWTSLELNLYGFKLVDEPKDARGKGSSQKPASSTTRTRTRRSSATSAP
jgi:hypothetical protein